MALPDRLIKAKELVWSGWKGIKPHSSARPYLIGRWKIGDEKVWEVTCKFTSETPKEVQGEAKHEGWVNAKTVLADHNGKIRLRDNLKTLEAKAKAASAPQPPIDTSRATLDALNDLLGRGSGIDF